MGGLGATSLPSTAAAAFVLVVLLAAARLHGAGATEYTVGDSAGWTIGPNYLAWSQKYNFTAGDTLVFSYVPVQHNVYRVTQDAFRSCEAAANQTMGSWATGRDLVNLTVPGDYYFICNVAGHCLGGMKFAVKVAAPPPPPPPSPPPPPPPGPAAGAAAARELRRRRVVVDRAAAARVGAGGGADPSMPRRDRPADSCVVVRSSKAFILA